jgi:hypothetical protein
VLQFGVYAHSRAVIVSSAQEGARYAANADVPTSAGAARTLQLISEALSSSTADGLSCSAAEDDGGNGVVVVVVHCTGAVPSIVAPLGRLLPIDVTGRAVKEGTS